MANTTKHGLIRRLKSTHIFSRRLTLLTIWLALTIIATVIYYKNKQNTLETQTNSLMHSSGEKPTQMKEMPQNDPLNRMDAEIRNAETQQDGKQSHGKPPSHAPNRYQQDLKHNQNIPINKQSVPKQIDSTKSQAEEPLKPNHDRNYKSESHYKCVYDKKQLSGKERIVHLDLKGAPPKMEYYRKLFPLLHNMGATGLLIEYEDMFPYSGDLRDIASPNAYTPDEVRHLLQLAEHNQLTTIPLIQTFGHMEFVLKHDKFANLREFKNDPRILSPVFNESWTLITAMIDQIAQFHDRSWYFHIGCDEVYRLGGGASKGLMAKRGWQPDDLFTWHVKRVVDYVSRLMYKPMMWADMLRRAKMTVDKIQKSGLHETVNIVMWGYSKYHAISKRHTHLQKYEKLFKTFWVASAFKGGNARNGSVVSVGGRVTNQFEWLQLISDYKKNNGSMEMKGSVVTGWQRFDHSAVLCELLPAGIPSLAYCLRILQQGCFDEKSHRSISMDVLRCDSPVNLDLRKEIADPALCQFPGHEVYEIIQAVYCMNTKQTTKSQSVFATMGREGLKGAVRKHFGEVYNSDTVEEWLRLMKLS